MEPGDTPPADDEDEREDRGPGMDGPDDGDEDDGLPEDGPFGGNDREYVGDDAEGENGERPGTERGVGKESDEVDGESSRVDEESAADHAPRPEPGTAAADREGAPGEGAGANADPLSRFLHARSGPLMWVREFLSSAAIVLVVGLLLFGLSGVWPPMVAVESGSMEPHMEKGDLIFVTEPGRFAPDAAAADTGVVTHEAGRSDGYRTFGDYGSVVVYDDPSSGGSPIIHRAHLRVDEGENWYERAEDDYMAADSCEELRNCPAPAAGYITKGDNNAHYDQAQGIAPVVREDWVTGVARLRVPYLGWIRLIATGQATLFGPTGAVPPSLFAPLAGPFAALGGPFGAAPFPGVAGVGAGLIGVGTVASRRTA